MSIHLQSNNLNQKRGPGFWKFNTSLLKDEAHVTALKINIPIFKKKYEETHDLGLKWDLIKMEIRGFTLQYSKRKAKKYRDEEKSLLKSKAPASQLVNAEVNSVVNSSTRIKVRILNEV